MPGITTKELMARIGHASPRAAPINQHATEQRDREIAAYLDDVIPEPREVRSHAERALVPLYAGKLPGTPQGSQPPDMITKSRSLDAKTRATLMASTFRSPSTEPIPKKPAMTQIDPHVIATVRAVLGPLYDELVGVMIDLATPPLFLMADDRPRLAAVRDRAATQLREWVTAHPAEAADLIDLLPQVLQLPDTAESLLEAAPWDDYFRLPASTFELPTGSAPVFSAVPSLLDRADDDGLLDVDGLEARPHGLFVGDFSLHYHQLLRRGFGSNIHYTLTGAVLGLARRHEQVRARIAIDERRLRRRDEHKEIEERDYWYGPPIDEAKLDDLAALGETVHGDPECGRSVLCPYWAVSIRWTRDGSGPLKSVEIEEFMPIGDEAAGPVLTRYLHAIRDTQRHAFVHCDGAVKAYDRAAYPTDLDEFRRRGKGLHYRKVFRLDGPLSADEWSHVTALWFRGNSLVPDYLTGLTVSKPSA